MAESISNYPWLDQPIEGGSKEGDELRQIVEGKSTKPVYNSASGGWTTDPAKAVVKASISLDKKSGNVRLDAPKAFLESEYYKETMKPQLLEMSQAYKMNPQYKYALTTDKENTKTTEEWVKELDKDIVNQAQQAMQMESIKAQVKESSGVSLDNSQLAKMSASMKEYRDKTGQVIQVKDTDSISLPKRIRDMAAFSQLEDYDESSHQTTVRAFKEAWDREKVSDADIVAVQAAVEDYFEKGDFSDADEYAEMVAFSETIGSSSPHTGVVRTIKDFAVNLGYGVLTGGANFVVGVSQVSDAIINSAGGALASGWAANLGMEQPEMQKIENGRVAKEWLDGVVSQHQEYNKALNPAMNFLTVVGYEGVPIIGQIAVGAIVGGVAGGVVGGAVGGLATGATEGGAALESIALSETLASNLYTGTEAILKMQSVAQANASIAGAVQTLTKVAPIAGSLADVAAQTTVDVALTDPTLFQRFIEGDGNEEEKAYVLEQIKQNVIFWGTGVTIGKAAKGFAKTPAGKVANAFTATKVAWLKVKMGNAADAIRTAMHRGNADWAWDEAAAKAAKAAADPNSIRKHNRAVAAERRATVLDVNRSILRKADENISQLGFKGVEGWDDLVKRATDIRASQAEQLAAANSLADAIYTAGTAQKSANLAAKYTTFRTARDSYLKTLSKVVKAERAAGITTARKISDAAGKLVPAMSKETNEYVNAVLRVSYLNPYRTVADPNKYKAIDEELAHWNKAIEAFRNAHAGDGLVDVADELVLKARALQKEIGDMRVGERVLSAEVLANQRAAVQWQAGYVRQQRMSDFTHTGRSADVLQAPRPRDYQAIRVGSTEEYADLSWVLFDDINDVAKQSLRKEMLADLRTLGYEMKYTVSGDDVKLANDVTPFQTKAMNAIQRNTDKIVKDISDDVFVDSFKLESAKGEIRAAEAKEQIRGAKVAGTKAKDYTLSDRKLKKVLADESMIPDEVAEQFSVDILGKRLRELSEEEFNKFMEKASLRTRNILYDAAHDPLDITRLFENKRTFSYDSFRDAYPLDLADSVSRKGMSSTESELAVYRSMLAENYDGIHDHTYGGATPRQLATDVNRQKAIEEAETVWKKSIDDLEKIRAKYNLPEMETNLNTQVDSIIDDVIEANLSNDAVIKAIKPLSGDAIGDDSVEYVTLRSLADDKNLKTIGNRFYSQAKRRYNEMLTASNPELKKSIPKISEDWAKRSEEWLKDRILQRYGESAQALSDAGSPLVDKRDIFRRVRDINAEITGARSLPNVVKTYSGEGLEEYIELSPTVARMITTRPNVLWRGPFGEIQQRLTRVFRFGTTGGLVPNSLITQWFRDTGNALVGGDALLSNSRVEQALADEFGDVFAKYYAENVPDVYQSLVKQAKTEGETVGEATAKYETALGRSNADTQLESRLYSSAKENYFQRNAEGVYDASVFENISGKFDSVMDKAEYLNNLRETYLRSRVYDNNLLLGLRQGMSVPEAQNFAKFVQANATTNFGRWMYHLTNLQQTVPYLGAAINGTKSFFRLMAFDPVGVTSRMIGGYIAPIIAITGHSLQDEETRRIYKQIPEYEKENNFVFVYNGQVFSIPVPQEVSTFVRPLQSAVEAAYGANEHGFNELLVNDLVAFSPYDLSGFVNIDRNPLTEDNLWESHISPGLSRLASQMLPPLAKSAVIAGTGIDPYTMKPVDTSYVVVDPETGEQEVMGSNAGAAAEAISGVLGDNVSAGMAQSVLNNLLGKGNATILNGITGLAVAVVDKDKTLGGAVEDFLQAEVERTLSPLTVSRYGEQVNTVWRQEVSRLYRKKEAIMADDAYQKDLQLVNSATATEEAKNKAKSRIATIQEGFQQEVLTVTQNLVKMEGGVIDRNKFASAISLLTFVESTAQNPYDPNASYLNSQGYYSARAAAVETMAKLGFSSSSDFSIFGYYKQNEDGSIGIVYNSPLSVLNYDLSSSQQDDIHLANIRALVSDAGLYEQKKAMQEQVNALYGKKKVDYDKINAIYINWNAQVMKTVAPYIQKMTPEAAINNSAVLDYLDGYIEVPGDYKKNSRGYYVTNRNLGKGNASQAYIRNYIKEVFRVNDTGYYGGYNFSGRK